MLAARSFLLASLFAVSGVLVTPASATAAGIPDGHLRSVMAAPPDRPATEVSVFGDEGDAYRAGPAGGWIVNHWGTPAPKFWKATRRSASSPFASVQSFELIDRGGGDAQPARQFEAERGRTYTWQVYARAPKGSPTVTFGLRRDDPHYDFFAAETVKLDSNWRGVVVAGRFPHTRGYASARIVVEGGGAIEFASAGLTMRDGTPSSGASWQGRVPDEFFGMTVNRLGTHNQWPGLGTRVLRLWDTGTRWMDLEPARGRWDFRRADYYLDYAQAHDAEILFTLGQTPRWAASRRNAGCEYGSGCSPPQNLDDWRNYVRTLATRYGSRVRYWELWNEPDYGGFWSGSPQKLAQMARIAREEISRANPNAVLIGPAVTQYGMGFLSSFLRAPGAEAIGAISFHTYMNKSLDELSTTLFNVRSVMADNGAGALPLWNTEFGVSCDVALRNCADPTERHAAAQRSVAALFVMAAHGLRNADFYFWERAWPDSPFGLALGSKSLEISEEGQLYAAAVELLAGARIEGSFRNENLTGIRFAKGNRKLIALWSEGAAIRMTLPEDWPFTTYRVLRGPDLTPERDGSVFLPASNLVIGSN